MGHSWLPLRAYGQGYRPFAWQTAPTQDTIWLNEGFIWYITTYYALAQKQLDFYTYIVKNAPAFISEKNLQELSVLGSTQYSLDFRIGKNLFARGALFAHQLDQHLLTQSAGKKSLVDVINYLISYTEKNPRGYTYDQLPALFKTATGVDCQALWVQWQAPGHY